MTQSFDEWYFDAKQHNIDGFTNREFYEAGAASRQAEVDELQKRVDKVTRNLESIKADSLRPSHHDYDKGWRDCAITVLNDLKGNQND